MTIRVWDLRQNKQRAILEGHSRGIKSLAISKDNKYIVSGSYDKYFRIWILRK